MLFQFLLTKFFKSELFSCLQKVDEVTNWKISPIARFIEDVGKQRRIFLSLSKLECIRQEDIHYLHQEPISDCFWHFQRNEVNAPKFEETRIHFKSDGFAAFAIVNTNAPEVEHRDCEKTVDESGANCL